MKMLFIFLFTLLPMLAEQSRMRVEWHQRLSRFEELRNERNFLEAERLLLDLLKDAKRTAPNDDWIAGMKHHAATLYHELGRYPEAERYYKEALKFWGHHQPEHLADEAAAVNNLAVLYLEQYRAALAMKLYKKYQPRWLVSLASDHDQIATSWHNLGTIYFQRRSFSEAEKYWGRALAMREKGPDPEHPNLIASFNDFGVYYAQTGRLDKALESFTRVLTLDAGETEHDALAVIRCNLNIAAIHCRLKHFEESEKYYERALQDVLNTIGPEHPLSASTASEYAKALQLMNRDVKAREMKKLANMLREAGPDPVSKRHTVSVAELLEKKR